MLSQVSQLDSGISTAGTTLSCSDTFNSGGVNGINTDAVHCGDVTFQR